MQIKYWGIILVVTAMALLAACGTDDTSSNTGTEPPVEDNGGGSPAPETPPAPPEQKPERKDPVDLTIVTPDATFTEEYVARLNEIFPLYNITHYNQDKAGSKITELLTVGTPIDIIGRASGGFAAEVMDNQLQYDMSEYIKQYNIDLTEFEPQLVNFIRTISDGGMYGLPGGAAINLIIFYNKDVFDRFGVDYPTDGMTWPEFMDLAARMTRHEDGQQVYGFTGNTAVMLNWNQLGIGVADSATNKPTINTNERWRTLFQTLFGNTTLNTAYQSGGRKFTGGLTRLINGDTAMFMFNANTAVINEALQTEQIEWDMIALPTFPEARNAGSPMNSTIFGMTSITRDREAAMDVIHYLVSDENLGAFSKRGYLVAKQTDAIINSFASEAKPADKNWNAIIYNEFASFPDRPTYASHVLPVYTEHLEYIVSGEMDMNTAFREIEEKAQQIINEHLAR